jgi:D-alanine-D-alanine ligase
MTELAPPLQDALERLKDRMRIAVIHGGTSTEEGAVLFRTHNPRSTKTYKAVAQDIADALVTLGFRHVTLFPDDMRLGDNLRSAGIDFAWLNTGGTQGYAPTCHGAAMLELYGIPYVGHNPLNSALLDNKHAFKHLLAGLQIKTAPFMTWDGRRGLFKPRINSLFTKTFGDFDGPFIVKPISGRASVNVEVAAGIDDLPDLVGSLHNISHNLILIERYLPGAEYCVAVCGPTISQNRRLSRRGNAFCFSLIERVLAPDEAIFTSMDIKPITHARVRLLDPANEPQLTHDLTAIAQSVYLDCAVEAAIRLDIRADDAGVLHVIEANPKPDMKRATGDQISLITAGLAQEGMDYEDLILSQIADRLSYLLYRRGDTVPHLLGYLQ